MHFAKIKLAYLLKTKNKESHTCTFKKFVVYIESISCI